METIKYRLARKETNLFENHAEIAITINYYVLKGLKHSKVSYGACEGGSAKTILKQRVSASKLHFACRLEVDKKVLDGYGYIFTI